VKAARKKFHHTLLKFGLHAFFVFIFFVLIYLALPLPF
jgi:hypothetical protein